MYLIICMIAYIPNIVLAIFLVLGIGYFTKNVKKLIRNIRLGKEADVHGDKGQRWKNMARIALGQTKMVVRPIAGLNAHYCLSGFCYHQHRSIGNHH